MYLDSPISHPLMLVLVAGDGHIPYRASAIPELLKKLLVPGKIQQVVSVGNLSDPESKQLLQRITPSKPIIAVPGSEDTIDGNNQTTQVFNVGKVRIGVVSSFEIIPQDDTDSLAAMARKLDVQVLLWGSCHQDTQNWADHYFITPGSISGVATAAELAEGVTKTEAGFCLLDVNDAKCTVYMYKVQNGKLEVEKAELEV